MVVPPNRVLKEATMDSEISKAPEIGALQGEIDNVTPYRVRGWARNTQRTEEPVVLIISNNGEILDRIIANLFREDLLEAGLESGYHGFDVWLPKRLEAARRNILRVFRESDGAELYRSPVILESTEAFGPVLQNRITDLLAAPMEVPDLRQRIEFFSGLVDGLRQRLVEEHSTAERRGVSGTANHLGRALVIDDQLPDPSRDAGSLAILSHVRSLKRLGYAVSFVPSDLAGNHSSLASSLEIEGVTVYLRPHLNSVEELLRREMNTYDLVYIHRYANAARYGALARLFQPMARIVFSVADLHYLRLQRQSERFGSASIAAESQLVRLRELSAAWSVSSVITHSADEAELLREALPQNHIAVVPWAVAPRPVTRLFDRRRGLAFVGGFRHAPNLDAALRLVYEIMPRVWQTAPDIPCYLVGSDMPDEIANISVEGIEILGKVSDLSAVFNRVRLTVAPLTWGAGVKGKVLESFAFGIPCAMTNIAAEGIALPNKLDVCLGESDDELAQAILSLHEDAEVNRDSADAGLSMIVESWSEERVDAAMRFAIERVERSAPA